MIPLTETLAEILKLCPSFGAAQDAHIFTSGKKSTSSTPLSIRKSFSKALKISKIEKFRFHDLRHTAASHIAMRGATQGELMAILGHRSPTMTRRYAHYSQSHLTNILEKLGSTIIKSPKTKGNTND